LLVSVVPLAASGSDWGSTSGTFTHDGADLLHTISYTSPSRLSRCGAVGRHGSAIVSAEMTLSHLVAGG
jgi:hypothetical protein